MSDKYGKTVNDLKRQVGSITKQNYFTGQDGNGGVVGTAGDMISSATTSISSIPYIKYVTIPLAIFIVLMIWRPAFLYTEDTDGKKRLVVLRAVILSICISAGMAIAVYAYYAKNR